MATYVNESNVIDHTPGSAVGAGDVVVLNGLVGVAKLDIPANTLGSLTITGTFDFPKATGVGTDFSVGNQTYWDAGNTIATGNNTFPPLGRAVKAAATTDATVRVRLNQ